MPLLAALPLPAADPAALWAALTAAGRGLNGAVQVVVVRGEGADFFAGTAVNGPSDEPPAAAIGWLRRPDLITIAAISGRASGPGLDVALACDLRVVADDAQLSPSGSVGGTAALGELMGYPRALEFIVTGRAISGQRAAAVGLANLSVRPDTLHVAVDELAAAILRSPGEVATVAKAVLMQSAADRLSVAAELASGLRLANQS